MAIRAFKNSRVAWIIFLLDGAGLAAAAAAKLLQSSPTLCDLIDGSQPGSPIPGILQARTLEWVAISFSNVWKWKMKVKVKSLSRVRPFMTPWTAAMGFSRQEYWSGLPLPSPGLLLTALERSRGKFPYSIFSFTLFLLKLSIWAKMLCCFEWCMWPFPHASCFSHDIINVLSGFKLLSSQTHNERVDYDDIPFGMVLALGTATLKKIWLWPLEPAV